VEQRFGIAFAQIYNDSNIDQQNKELMKEMNTPTANTKDLHLSTQFAQIA
jgi:hypothetical protein